MKQKMREILLFLFLIEFLLFQYEICKEESIVQAITMFQTNAIIELVIVVFVQYVKH